MLTAARMLQPSIETTYRLYGVISHRGDNPSSGHYTALVKDASDLWHLMDDASVSRVTAGRVPTDLNSAYILFYVREKGQVLRDAISNAATAIGEVSTSTANANVDWHGEKTHTGSVSLSVLGLASKVAKANESEEEWSRIPSSGGPTGSPVKMLKALNDGVSPIANGSIGVGVNGHGGANGRGSPTDLSKKQWKRSDREQGLMPPAIVGSSLADGVDPSSGKGSRVSQFGTPNGLVPNVDFPNAASTSPAALQHGLSHSDLDEDDDSGAEQDEEDDEDVEWLPEDEQESDEVDDKVISFPILLCFCTDSTLCGTSLSPARQRRP